MLKVSVSMMKKLSQDGRLASLPADTISMSPARNQGVKLELDAPTAYFFARLAVVGCVEILPFQQIY